MPSAIGDVVPALVSTFTTALAAETGVEVYSGPRPVIADALEYVTVGWDPEGAPGVTTDQELSDLGNRWVEETGEAVCSVTCWSGDDDMPALLARCDDLLDTLDASLAADPRRGGVLAQGHFARVLGRGGLEQAADGNGYSVRLTFTVRYSTLLTT